MSTRIVLKNVRLSFPALFEPKKVSEDSKPKYSVMLLVPKDNTEAVEALFAAEKEAIKAGKEKFGEKKFPSKPDSIIKDGDADEEKLEQYPERAGNYLMTVQKNPDFGKPGLVDKYNRPIEDRAEVYSGVMAHVSVTAYPYVYQQMKKGTSFGLNNIMVLGEGEPLAGVGMSAESEFQDFAEDIASVI